MPLPTSRRFGIAIVLISAMMWSTAGLFVRMAAELDLWTMVGWRSAFTCGTLGAYVWLRNRLEPAAGRRSFGWPGVAAALVSLVASVSYVAALQWTSVANVMTIYATLPFLATAIGYVWLGDRVSGRFVVAGLAAFCGIAVTVGASLSPQDLLGLAAALVMTAGFGLQLVIARRFPTLDSTLMMTLAAGLCVLVALPFMQWSLPGAQALTGAALYGVLTTGVAYVLVLMGSRLTGSGEAGLISMLDVVLGPFWVWLVFGEQVSSATVIGGSIVLFSVIGYLAAPAPRRKQALGTS